MGILLEIFEKSSVFEVFKVNLSYFFTYSTFYQCKLSVFQYFPSKCPILILIFICMISSLAIVPCGRSLSSYGEASRPKAALNWLKSAVLRVNILYFCN
jgi:hypothetical protein